MISGRNERTRRADWPSVEVQRESLLTGHSIDRKRAFGGAQLSQRVLLLALILLVRTLPLGRAL